MAAVAPVEGDIEQGVPPAPDNSQEKEEFNPWYYYVYAFSMFVCVIGLLAFFLGGDILTNPLQYLTGALLLAVGIYLPLQADLIVTYFRLTRETARFKENNKRFKSGLKRQEAQIRKLQKAERAFDKLDKQFGGSIEKAFEELEELQASAKDKIQQSANSLLSMYSANKDRMITAGAKIEEAVEMLTMLYCRIFPNFFTRMTEMKKGIETSTRFENDQALTADRMGKAFQTAVSADKVEEVQDKVKVVMAEKGRNTLEKEIADGIGSFLNN